MRDDQMPTARDFSFHDEVRRVLKTAILRQQRGLGDLDEVVDALEALIDSKITDAIEAASDRIEAAIRRALRAGGGG